MIKFAVFVLLFVNLCVKSKADNSKVKSSTQPIQCPGFNETVYECHTGYCCDKDACCPHYYELWWFWVIWVVTILLAFCCAYHQKRKRPFQSTPLYPTTDAPDLYAGACNYPGPPADKKQEMLGYTKLPIYDDVIRVPPSASPPPPYSSGRQPVNTVAYVQKEKNGTSLQVVPCNVTSSMLSLASLSHYIPDILIRNNINMHTPCSESQMSIDQNNNQSLSNFKIENETGMTSQSSITTLNDDVINNGASSSLVTSAQQGEIPANRIVHRATIEGLSLNEDSDSMSECSDDWMLHGNHGGVDPNNNNLRVDDVIVEEKDELNEEEESGGDVLLSNKMNNSPVQDPIQNLIEDPRPYEQ